MEPAVLIEYRDKKNSSGKFIDGVIKLSISSHLSPQEQEKHIKSLVKKLQTKFEWAQRYKFQDNEGIVKTDEDLACLADTINKAYYGYPLSKATFHRQESTWGTCSLKTRQIYLSHRLVGAPLDLLWYVVTHELCHLDEPSHNQRFWTLVSKACPNYLESRKMLKAYGLMQLSL